jgi:diaminopimelate epimerase
VEFVKAHGTGNDFVVVEDLAGHYQLTPELVRAVCDRHFGVGADGLIRIAPGTDAPFFMDYRNADGSLAEMCGNGVRVVGKYLGDRGLVSSAFDLFCAAEDAVAVEGTRRLAELGIAAGECSGGAMGAAGRLLADAAVRATLEVGPGASVLVLLTEGVTDPEAYARLVVG